MLVLDCSAAVNIARDVAEGVRFKSLIAGGDHVITPRLLYSEATNVFWKYVRAGEMTLDEALDGVQAAVDLVDEFFDEDDYYVEALRESCRYGHPAYDFYYLLLARRTGATLLTCDRKLAALAGEMGIACA